MEATGNMFAVSKSMGHADIKSMEPYQHQKIEPLVIAINQRNADRVAFSGVGHTIDTLTVRWQQQSHEY
jgi:hypothetical protein